MKNDFQFERFKVALNELCEKHSIDGAFLVVVIGDEIFGATVKSGKSTYALFLLEALEQANFSTLNGGRLPEGYSAKKKGGAK